MLSIAPGCTKTQHCLFYDFLYSLPKTTGLIIHSQFTVTGHIPAPQYLSEVFNSCHQNNHLVLETTSADSLRLPLDFVAVVCRSTDVNASCYSPGNIILVACTETLKCFVIVAGQNKKQFRKHFS